MNEYLTTRNEFNKRVFDYLRDNHKKLPHGFFVSNKTGLKLCHNNKKKTFSFTDLSPYKDASSEEIIYPDLYFKMKDHKYWKYCSSVGLCDLLVDPDIGGLDKWEEAITQSYNKLPPDMALALLAFALENKELEENYRDTHKKIVDNNITIYEMYINAK